MTPELLAADAKGYLEYSSGPTVEQLIASGKQFDRAHNTFVIPYHPHEENNESRLRWDALTPIRSLTVNSDAAVIGIPLTRQSQLTDSHHFVFSDYEVRITSVLADKNQILSAGETIVVTRAGGAITLDGHNIRAVETEFQLFHLNTPYLFFLHRSASGSFSLKPSDAYMIDGDTVKSGRLHPIIENGSLPLSQVTSAILTTANGARQ